MTPDEIATIKAFYENNRDGTGRHRHTAGAHMAMIASCNDERTLGFKNIGARGIKVVPRWQTYAGFVADMGEKPYHHSIDRHDPTKDFGPDNAYWRPMSSAEAAHQDHKVRKLMTDPNRAAGRKRTQTKRKPGYRRRGKIVVCSNGKAYPSVVQAAEDFGSSPYYLVRAADGFDTVKGHYFMFEDERRQQKIDAYNAGLERIERERKPQLELPLAQPAPEPAPTQGPFVTMLEAMIERAVEKTIRRLLG